MLIKTCRAIMLTPFTPFFVLLCHVLDTSNLSDLQHLENFTSSLQPAAPFSESVQKLHRLCQVMCSIAKLYVEAKAKKQQRRRQQQQQRGRTGSQGGSGSWDPVGVDSEFEMYLDELGFMSVDFDPLQPLHQQQPQQQQHQQQQYDPRVAGAGGGG